MIPDGCQVESAYRCKGDQALGKCWLGQLSTKAPAIPEWGDDEGARRAALNGCLYVLEEHDDDEE